MLDLNYIAESVAPIHYAAAPQLAFKVRITQTDSGEPFTLVHNILLQCQIRIEPALRHYDNVNRERLVDLFGEPSNWRRSLNSMLWTHVSTIVPAFTDSIVVNLAVPCTFDFNVAATKYFDGLEEGSAPLCLLFSGSIFYHAEAGGLQIMQIPWEKECRFDLPVQIWREMMDHYYPNRAWLCICKDVFDRLSQFKSQYHLPTWEQALESLLDCAREEARS